MKHIRFLWLPALFVLSCENKKLCDDDGCGSGNVSVKVVVNWEEPAKEARAMRINLFSQTDGVTDYGRDAIPASGEKHISLVENASYRPLCYDYNSNVSFRNETTLGTFQAYVAETYRATYNTLATPVPGEATVIDPGGDFYVHPWLGNFDVVFGDTPELTINFYPENILRTFTYRINNAKGATFANEARGAISGMAATYQFLTGQLTAVRSTVLFDKARTGTTSSAVDYVEGTLTTFGPVSPYQNRFTIELLAGNKYYTAYWDVSGQIAESMVDRESKLARDGYDILIDNDGRLPEIPEPEAGGSGSGFEIGVDEWNNVEIYL